MTSAFVNLCAADQAFEQSLPEVGRSKWAA
jgi:hypothetical protein